MSNRSRPLDTTKYQQVPGDPAFPPPSIRREDEYIERMIQRDREIEKRDNTLPVKK